MRQWEIYDFPFPTEREPHPFVVLSADDVPENREQPGVNALLCVTLRAGRTAKRHHVQLDESDGLDRATIVSCNVIHYFPKATAGRRHGAVTAERRAAICRVLRSCLRIV